MGWGGGHPPAPASSIPGQGNTYITWQELRHYNGNLHFQLITDVGQTDTGVLNLVPTCYRPIGLCDLRYLSHATVRLHKTVRRRQVYVLQVFIVSSTVEIVKRALKFKKLKYKLRGRAPELHSSRDAIYSQI